MGRLRQVSLTEASPEIKELYKQFFGDRDPVKEPGTATGTPGDYWTTFALVPDILFQARTTLGSMMAPGRKLPAPLRDRFGFTAHMEFYEPEELELVLRRAGGILRVDLRPDGAREIARRSRGTPRIANRLLRRVRDYAEVRADGAVKPALAQFSVHRRASVKTDSDPSIRG